MKLPLNFDELMDGPDEPLMLTNFGSKGGEKSVEWESGNVALKNSPANAVARRFVNKLIPQTAANRIWPFLAALMSVS
jgi:hypothetical protein